MVIKIRITADKKQGCSRLQQNTKNLIIQQLDNAISDILRRYKVSANRRIFAR